MILKGTVTSLHINLYIYICVDDNDVDRSLTLIYNSVINIVTQSVINF